MGSCLSETTTMGWNVVGASEIGTAHLRNSSPCQDYSLFQTVETDGKPILVLACADGAGSAQYAKEAAEIACREIQNFVLDGLLYLGDVASIEQENVLSWYSGVRDKLQEAAQEKSAELGDFACTLLLALLGPEICLFAQVGDGAIVYRDNKDQQYKTVFWPDNGEYMNITTFLSSEGFERSMQVKHLSAKVDNVALITDGLELLALNFKERQAHGPFFAPMFERLSQVEDAASLEPLLRQFLQSDSVNSRTDDDKTILMGARMQAPPGAENG